MMSAGKPAWLAEGLALLAEQGAPAVTLDRLCERMGMSKGSFYHHFGSMPKYRRGLLSHFEAEHTTAIIDAVQALAELPARERLGRLVVEAIKDTGPDLEIAMRAWAKQDPEAASVQGRVDATRIAYLRDLCHEAGHPQPEQMATLLYVMWIGAAHLMPPLPGAQLRGLYEAMLALLDRPTSYASAIEESAP
ncbi:TetR/AcrR family transcriptional regulator [Streptomyces sp. DSM 41987]|uniref:TetR/AcrR family transcriptional regulator n=1 Tax=Streptomyces TaxID=1883 RepID=UPI0018DF235F|nr:TetR/AcrR family transcriptional regulator [Streptomyces fildesensis]